MERKIEMFCRKKKINCTFLSSCTKRSKTPPPLDAPVERRSGASLTHVERYLFENFRSLYERMDFDHISDSRRRSSTSGSRRLSRRIREVDNDDDGDDLCRSFYIKEPVDFSPRLTDPQLEIIRASKRFFATPIIASSLVEEARLSGAAGGASSSEKSKAVTVFSEKPYDDFRRSMTELMEAHHAEKASPEFDWEFMEEMLLSYLELNDRSVHQHILKAFADLSATSAASAGAIRRRRDCVSIS